MPSLLDTLSNFDLRELGFPLQFLKVFSGRVEMGTQGCQLCGCAWTEELGIETGNTVHKH